MKKKNLSRVTSRIPNSMRECIDKIALDNEATTSEVIRFALKRLIEDEKL